MTGAGNVHAAGKKGDIGIRISHGNGSVGQKKEQEGNGEDKWAILR